MNEFGNKIKQLRGKESLRQAAKNIGISHTYLDSLEKGYDPRTNKERKPTIEVIRKIADYYKIDFFELVKLTNLFVGINDLTDDEREQEAQKIRKLFNETKEDNQNILKDRLILLSKSDLSVTENMFFTNIIEYFYEENGNNENLKFMAVLFRQLNMVKDSGSKEAYQDLINEFDNFLKQYLKIK